MTAYRDAIGDRLDHPERVPAEFQHLIPDDRQRVARLLAMPLAGRVLDVGSSDGAITARLAKAWPSAEINRSDIRFLVDHEPDGWIQWDIRETFPLAVAPFGTVLCCEVLEHLSDADVQIAWPHLLRVIAHGGDLILTVPNRQCAERYVVGCRDRWRWPDHRSVWRYETAQRLLAPCFRDLQFVPLYEADQPWESIWIIVRAIGRL